MNFLLSKGRVIATRMHLLSERILDWGGHVISKVARPSEDFFFFLQNNISNLNFSWKCSAYLTFWILWWGNALVKQRQHPVQASVSVLSQSEEREVDRSMWHKPLLYPLQGGPVTARVLLAMSVSGAATELFSCFLQPTVTILDGHWMKPVAFSVKPLQV